MLPGLGDIYLARQLRADAEAEEAERRHEESLNSPENEEESYWDAILDSEPPEEDR